MVHRESYLTFTLSSNHLLEDSLLDEDPARNEYFWSSRPGQGLLYSEHLHKVVLLLDVLVYMLSHRLYLVIRLYIEKIKIAR